MTFALNLNVSALNLSLSYSGAQVYLMWAIQNVSHWPKGGERSSKIVTQCGKGEGDQDKE